MLLRSIDSRAISFFVGPTNGTSTPQTRLASTCAAQLLPKHLQSTYNRPPCLLQQLGRLIGLLGLVPICRLASVSAAGRHHHRYCFRFLGELVLDHSNWDCLCADMSAGCTWASGRLEHSGRSICRTERCLDILDPLVSFQIFNASLADIDHTVGIINAAASVR